MAGNNAERRGFGYTERNLAIREIIDLYNFRERTKEEVLADVNNAPPEHRVGIIRSYLRNIDDTLVQSFDTGEWFQDIISLRGHLQGDLERYTSLEFKIEGLDAFFGEVKTRLTERMREAHSGRGNDWLWSDIPQETSEEYIDVAGYSIFLLRKLQLAGAGQVGTQIEQPQLQPEADKTSLESKLTGFDEFINTVRQRISQGDATFGDRWLIEDQPRQIQNELIDTIGYAYFGWRKAKMLGQQEKGQEQPNNEPSP